jgi:hypothetical protein
LEISRILKHSGAAIFYEPLSYNPLINLFRFVTPSLRSRDEHPIVMSDFIVLEKYFNTVEVKYFHLFSLAAIPFSKSAIFIWMHKVLTKLDSLVENYMPYLLKYSWICVIILSNPKKLSKEL